MMIIIIMMAHKINFKERDVIVTTKVAKTS